MHNRLLKNLRQLIQKYDLDGFLIPSNDEFQSEYVPEYLNRLKFLTGFSGSNGLALVTKEHSIFFTDGRYFLQAEQEVGHNYLVQDISTVSESKFLHGNIGYDPKLHTSINLKKYKNCSLVACNNLIDEIWLDRPQFKAVEIFEYPLKYAGETSESKMDRVKKYLKERQLDALIITNSTNICWLLNIRAHDVAYNPILLSYLIFYSDGSYELFSNSFNTKQFLEFSSYLNKLKHKKVLLDGDSASDWVISHFKNPIIDQDPCTLMKACKNNTEIKQAQKVHVTDGIALCKMLYWLDKQEETTETDVADKLLELRSNNSDFLYPSFATIAGFADNGAVIHYHPTEETNKIIKKNGLLLIDSGGQYFGGTTDITRVIPVGKATYEQKIDFTLVLKGHIALANAVFPKGTSGEELDILARQFLWKNGKNYPHGTGHGVGSCLSVHEAPPRIGKFAKSEIKAGMIISNEPGYYKNGEYGIRIENLMLVKSKNDNYLTMETISLAPIDQRLILTKMLSSDEKQWLNYYHKQVYNKISIFLDKQEQDWLKGKTKPIKV